MPLTGCGHLLGRLGSLAASGRTRSREYLANVCATTMGCCTKKRLLTVMTSLCSCTAFAFLSISIATDYWLYASEKIHTNDTEVMRVTYMGLWRTCVYPTMGSGNKKCNYIDYFKEVERDGLGTTEAILYSMRRATLFPLIGVLTLLIGVIICFLGHCNHKRKALTFAAGIIFVMGGLCVLIGIILYIGAISEEVGNKAKGSASDPAFRYHYGTSFLLTIASFILAELTGVLSVYLYMSKYKHMYKKKQERMTVVEANERPNHTRHRRPRDRHDSHDASPSRSDSYYTYTPAYTPVSDTSREMSSFTFPRETSRNTISTTAETHLQRAQSALSVRELDTFRRTTPV